MKFHIISYDLQFLKDGQQSFRLDFKYTGEPKHIRIKLTEPIFETSWNEIGGLMRVGPGHSFFAATTLMNPFDSKFNLDLKLEFIEDETNEVLEKFILPTYAVDIKKRSLGSEFHKRNVWVIGDTHIGDFSPKEYDSPLLQEPNYTINPIGHPNLSLNKFIKNNYKRFLSTLPIMDGDTLLLMLGEIDCRVAFYRNSKSRNIPVESLINETLDNYIIALEDIQSLYPSCNIKISLPTPPVADGWITSENNLDTMLNGSKQHERYHIRRTFEFLIREKLKDTNIQILDLTKVYEDGDGFTDTTYLLEDNHHFQYDGVFINNITAHEG
jgi:hypothetical protein